MRPKAVRRRSEPRPRLLIVSIFRYCSSAHLLLSLVPHPSRNVFLFRYPSHQPWLAQGTMPKLARKDGSARRYGGVSGNRRLANASRLKYACHFFHPRCPILDLFRTAYRIWALFESPAENPRGSSRLFACRFPLITCGVSFMESGSSI